MNNKAFVEFLATGQYIPTMDAFPLANGQMTDLQKHDEKFHPHGFKDGDSCKYREARNLTKKSDEVDDLGGAKPNKIGYLPDLHPKYKEFSDKVYKDIDREQKPEETRYIGKKPADKKPKDIDDDLPAHLRNPYVRRDGKIGMSDAQLQKAEEWAWQHKGEIEAARRAAKKFRELEKENSNKWNEGSELDNIDIDKHLKEAGLDVGKYKSAIDKYLEAVNKNRSGKAAVAWSSTPPPSHGSGNPGEPSAKGQSTPTGGDKPSAPAKPSLNTPNGLFQHYRDLEKSLREKGMTQMADDALAVREDLSLLTRMQADIEKKMGGGENATLDKAMEGLAPDLFNAIKKAKEAVKNTSTEDLKAALKEGEANNAANLDAETRNLVSSLNNNSPSLSTGGNRDNVVKSLDSTKARIASELLQNWVITCELKRRGETV